MAKKPYTTTVIQSITRTVIIWAEDATDAMLKAENIAGEDGGITFEPQFPEVFASEAYESNEHDLGIFEHFVPD